MIYVYEITAKKLKINRTISIDPITKVAKSVIVPLNNFDEVQLKRTLKEQAIVEKNKKDYELPEVLGTRFTEKGMCGVECSLLFVEY